VTLLDCWIRRELKRSSQAPLFNALIVRRGNKDLVVAPPLSESSRRINPQ
jgi:hypothetical protein